MGFFLKVFQDRRTKMGYQYSLCLKETADVVDSIDTIKTDGRLQTLGKIDLNFGYRSSSFQYMEDLAAIVAVTFRLHPSGSSQKRLQEYLKRWSLKTFREKYRRGFLKFNLLSY